MDKKGGKEKILFICTHNSARSQIAEGILRHLFKEKYEVYSAGSDPTAVNPYAIKTMSEIGIDISNHRAKSLEEFKGQEFDHVITLCGEKSCPIFLGGKNYIQKEFENPAAFEGTENEKNSSFQKSKR